MKKKFEHICKRCDRSWKGFKEYPKSCFYCKSKVWNRVKPIEGHTLLKFLLNSNKLKSPIYKI